MIKTGDMLAGGGGVTHAMSRIPNIEVKFVLNHDQKAIRTNLFHHRKVKHYFVDIYKQDEHEVEYVDLLWASIECTQHSRANGGKEKKIGSYMMGWELVRYIDWISPYIIGIENVPEFKKWAPISEDGNPDKTKLGEEFERWKLAITSRGYSYHEKILNTADYGLPTRRIRYFAFFVKLEIDLPIRWPVQTHNKNGTNGLKKWEACGPYIDLTNEGESIFGRQFNINVKKGKRNVLSPNSLKRFAAGIKKYSPELQLIFQYYGNGINVQKIDAPLNTIPTKDRHHLVTIVPKKQFICDHIQADIFNLPEDPLSPILTRETKRLVTIEKAQFIADYFGREDTSQDINGPANAITTENSKHLVTTNFISHQFGTGINHSIKDPVNSLTVMEKVQFITAYFSSSGKQESQIQSIENPLGTVTTSATNKALVSAILEGAIDFDIKMRFLTPEELSRISTFPEKYFTHRDIKLSKKDMIKLIGNAVPPDIAELIIKPVAEDLDAILLAKKIAV